MAAKQHSLRITERYRARLLASRHRVERVANNAWSGISVADLDSSYAPWLSTVTAAVKREQRETARAASAYLSAFVQSELGRRAPTPRVDTQAYVGVTRAGTPLEQAYQFMIGVKGEIGKGTEPVRALELGKVRAIRAVGVDTDHAGRQALTDAMAQDPRVAGWKRAVKGTCDACLGLAEDAVSAPGTPLEIHPGCECVSEPVVKNVADNFPRPSGAAIFAAMTVARQVELFGEAKAQLLRDGEIDLSDCVEKSPLDSAPDFVTAKPLDKILKHQGGATPQEGRNVRDGNPG